MALSKAEIACDKIINNLNMSNLHFCVQETPFSAYITIRKKFSHKIYLEVDPQNLQNQKVHHSDPSTPDSDVVEALKSKILYF